MISLITERTKLSVSLVIVLVGGVFWLSTVHWNAAQAAKGVDEVKVEQSKQKDEYNKTINEINSRMARMEQSLKNIEERL